MKTNGRLQLFPILRVAIFFCVGIIIGDALYGVVGLYCWLVATAAAVAGALLLRRRGLAQSFMVFVASLFLGGCLTVFERGQTDVALPESAAEYRMVVISRPKTVGKTVRFDALITNCSRPLKVRAAMLADSYAARLSVGHGLSVRSVLAKPTNFQGATFDYRLWLLRHGYSATTFIPPGAWRGEAVSLKALSYVERARLAALTYRERLFEYYRNLSFEGDEYAAVAAMTLGDKSSLTDELREAYSISGASHVLALSGLHLGIIYTILTLLFGGRRRRLFAAPFVVLALWIYVFITGMSVSVVRAAVMLTVYTFVSLLNRDRMSLNTLSLAAMVLLVSNPLNFYDIGFQMSFLAVLFIFIFYRPVYSLLPGRWLAFRPIKAVWALVAVSVAAQIGVAPLTMFYFGRFSCYFLLANIIVVPAATVVLYVAVLLLLLAAVPVAGRWLAAVLERITALMNSGVERVAALPGASIEHININLMQLALLYVLIFTFYGIGVYVRKMYWERNMLSR